MFNKSTDSFKASWQLEYVHLQVPSENKVKVTLTTALQSNMRLLCVQQAQFDCGNFPWTLREQYTRRSERRTDPHTSITHAAGRRREQMTWNILQGGAANPPSPSLQLWDSQLRSKQTLPPQFNKLPPVCFKKSASVRLMGQKQIRLPWQKLNRPLLLSAWVKRYGPYAADGTKSDSAGDKKQYVWYKELVCT